ncbi:DARS1 [Symbiodinium sp. KB8]|nr:DARS1 [Symbiodinium sp. KB8]
MADSTPATTAAAPAEAAPAVAPEVPAVAADAAAAPVDGAKKEKKSKKGKKAKKGDGELTAKELRILKKQQEAEARAKAQAAMLGEKCGDTPVIQSREISGRTWTRLGEVTDAHVGQTILVRARVHTLRAKGKAVFLVLRQGVHTVQAVLFQGKDTPKEMIKYVSGISRESVVDVSATVSAVPEPIAACSIKSLELQVATLHTISRALPTLPFSVEDAARPHVEGESDEEEEEEAAAAAAAAEGEGDGERKMVRVSQKTRLDHRWIDLRAPAHAAILRISSGVCALYREFLLARGFTEIQSPKLIGGASEGGSEVFTLKYFGQDACLAQSPQLYKQMAAACSDLERVFEIGPIGPVFRAENSNTHRHLCEFHGLDMEMTINEHYYEVLDVFSDLFAFLFKGLQGIALLRADGVEIGDEDDLSTAQERRLGQIVKEKYGTDFFMMDKYPLSIRPFYTMPDPENPRLSNSYDFFMRGEEILSGAQRIHDVAMLEARAKEHDIPIPTIQGYVDSFKHGALPHGGGGVGLERVVMLFLGLPNVRKVCLFPRDPKRLFP